VSLQFRVTGGGQPLLSLGPDGPAQALLAESFRVLALPEGSSAADLMDLARSLKDEVGQCDVLGHGLGVELAATIAAQHPELVAQLVLAAPSEPSAELAARLSGIACLTLIVQGTRDSDDMGRMFRERIPSSYLAYVYGAGHDVAVDQPARFAGLVTEFLTRGEAFIINWSGDNAA
jgi:pimeloyl-ACP methyl ester carboxylesterase